MGKYTYEPCRTFDCENYVIVKAGNQGGNTRCETTIDLHTEKYGGE